MTLVRIAIVALCSGCQGVSGGQESAGTALQTALTTAIEAGDARAAEDALAAGADVDMALPSGERPLFRAVALGRHDLVSVCLDWCAEWRAPAPDQPDALTLAVVARDMPISSRLLEAGADPNARLPAPAPPVIREKFSDTWFAEQLRFDVGVTPLMLASVLGDEPMVRLLLAYGGRPDRRTRRYTTDAVVLACRAEQMRVAQILSSRDPDCPTNYRMVINLSEQRVTLFRGNEFVLSSRCSTGRKGYRTPPGEYLITTKLRQWVSTIYDVPMPWMMRLNSSPIGIHQGFVPGYPASHGCIRVPPGKAATIFKLARVGDRVEIVP